MRVTVGAATDIGRVREGNEDAFLVLEPLYVVADGMGGHLGGEVASNLAIDTIRSLFEARQGSLRDQVEQANAAVFERSQSDREVRGMGTTLTAALVEGSSVRIAHVGDSRAYIFRNDRLTMLTKDHTLVAKMVEDGEITAAEAETHPHRSIVTRVLGIGSAVQVDEGVLEMRDGDRLLLCSDGLTGMVSEDRMASILREVGDPQEAADRLVREANEAGGIDNITAVILDVHDDGSEDRASATTGRSTGEHDVPAAPPNGRDDVTVAHRLPTPVNDEQAFVMTTSPARAAVERIRPVPSRRGSVARRAGVWAGVTIAVLSLGFVGLRLFLDSQWYVGISNGRVAVFRGVPADVAGFSLHTVVVESEIPASRATELAVYRDLGDGITAEDRESAQLILDRIRADVAAEGSSSSARASQSPSPST